MRVAGLRAAEASDPAGPIRDRGRLLGWLPLVVISVGLVFGLVLWAKWGFLVAFETIRSYCF